MKLVIVLILKIVALINNADGEFIPTLNTNVSNLRGRVKLVSDIINDRTDDNVIVINDSGYEDQITATDDKVQSEALTILLADGVNHIILEELVVLNMKLNKKSFYVVLPQDHRKAVDLVKRIQATDQDCKIALVVPAGGLDSVDVYEKLKIYNIYIFIEDKEETSFNAYDVCRFCKGGGEDQINLINTWELKTGFRKPLDFRGSFRGNFHGETVVMGSMMVPPNIHVVGHDKDGSKVLDGTLYRNYQMMAKMLNFNLKVLSLDGRDNFNYRMYIRDVFLGRIELMGGGWMCGSLGYRYADVSTSEVHMSGYNIVSIEPLKGIQPLTAYITPFDGFTWGLILITIPLSGIALYVLSKFTPEPFSIWHGLWNVSVVACWDSIRCPQPSCGMIIHLSSYMLGFYLLISLYMGDYAADLIVPKYTTPPIETLDQFWNSDMKWASSFSNEYHWWYDYFGYISGVQDRHFNFTHSSGENFEVQALRKVAANPDSLVYFSPAGQAGFYIALHNLKPKGRKFFFSKETFDNAFACLYYAKHYYAKEAVNLKMKLIKDMAIHHVNTANYILPGLIKSAVKEGKELEEAEQSLVKMKHFVVGLYSCLASYCLATVVLIIEVVRFKVESFRKSK